MVARGTAHADTRVADQLVARVDGRPIFLSEIRARAKPRLVQLDRSNPMTRVAETQKIHAEILELQIEDEILRVLAVHLHVSIEDSLLEDVIEVGARHYGYTKEAYLAEAAGQGYSAAEYRSEIRKQLVRQRVILALGVKDKTLGPYPEEEAARSAWMTRAETAVLAREKRKACIERFVRW